MMKEAYHSMKILVSESQMVAMRATSTHTKSWIESLRLFSVYSLQIFSKAYVAKFLLSLSIIYCDIWVEVGRNACVVWDGVGG